MPFVNPPMVWFALGAMGVPVLIHLLNRRRYRRVDWAAMRFLEAAVSQRARRLRIEHLLLLLMRMGVVGLFGIAVARPFFPFSALRSVVGSRVHRVLVIDDSLSMSAVDGGGVSRFDLAMLRAREILALADAGDATSVVTMGGRARAVVGHAAYDARFVLERLGTLSVTGGGTDVAGGLGLAWEIARESGFAPGSKVVFVLSDFAGAAWGGDADVGVDERVGSVAGGLVGYASLVLVDVGGEGLSNVAITRFEQVGTSPVSVEMPLRLELTVSNLGVGWVDGVGGDVFADDRLVRRLVVEGIEGGGATTERFAVSGGDFGGGVIHAKMRPGDRDAVAGDNDRYLASPVGGTIDVLVVDGSGRFGVMGKAARFLSTALRPGENRGVGEPFEVTVVSEADWEREVLGNFDVVVLCDVGSLGESGWGGLGRYVARGGGLIVVGGGRVDRADYNEGGVLPVVIEDVVGGESGGAFSVSFSGEGLEYPVLADFAEVPETGLFSTRVWRYFRSEPIEGSEVLLRFDDGVAALVSGRLGEGVVCFFATSVDMSWNNLPAKGDYVALMVSLVSDVAWTARGSRSRVVGGRIVRRVSAGDKLAGVDVETPAGLVERASVGQDEDGFVMSYGPLEMAGRYAVRLGDRRIEYVANVVGGESDVAGVGEDALKEWLGCAFSFLDGEDGVLEGKESESVTHELWAILLVGVVLLLVGESWLAARLGASR